MLHLAGPDVQEIFSTVTAETAEATVDAASVTALNGYFVPRVYSAFARQRCQLQQKEGETVVPVVIWLTKEARDCNFGLNADNQIRDADLYKWTSNFVRRKLLEESQMLKERFLKPIVIERAHVNDLWT